MFWIKRIKTYIIDENNNPSLSIACKKIFNKIKHINNESEDNIICWLEDDWDICLDLVNDTFIKNILNLQMNNKWYMNLTCRDKIYFYMLAPCFMPYVFWYEYWFKALNNNDFLNNVCLCGKFFNKKYYLEQHIVNCNFKSQCPEKIIGVFINSKQFNFHVFNYSIDINNTLMPNNNINEKYVVYNSNIIIDSEININDLIYIRTIPALCFDIGIDERVKSNIKKIFVKGKERNTVYIEYEKNI